MITSGKITMRSAILCLVITLASSCSHNPDSKEFAEQSNDEKFDHQGEKGAEHLVNAYSDNLYEIKASENASMNAKDPQVKKIATMMVEAHLKMNTDIEKLATEKKVTLPLDLTEKQIKEMEKLTDKTGIDYDKAYLSDMKSKHEDAVAMLEGVSDKCEDPAIKTWASNTLPEVRSHLEMVNNAHDNIKNMK